MMAMQRLLDHEQALKQWCQSLVGAQCLIKITEAGKIVELLVAIQGRIKTLWTTFSDHGGDLTQTRQINRSLAADFDFKITQTIGADGFVQSVWQSVV